MLKIKLMEEKEAEKKRKLELQQNKGDETSLSGMKRTEKSDIMNEVAKRRESKKVNLAGL